MNSDLKRDVLPTAPGIPGGAVVLRVLAVADAIALQSLLLYWVWGWPKHGSLVGAVCSALLVWWALKRVSRALFDYEHFRWFAWRLLKLALLAWLIEGAVYLAS